MADQPRPVTLDGRPPADSATVEFVEAQAGWPQRYAEALAEIDGTLQHEGILGVRFEHVGSTAVPGLGGRPLIDIVLLPPETLDRADLVELLLGLGYRQTAEGFAKDQQRLRIVAAEQANQALRLRDWLRQHPEDAATFNALKRKLVDSPVADAQAYARGKQAFFATLIALAEAEQAAAHPPR